MKINKIKLSMVVFSMLCPLLCACSNGSSPTPSPEPEPVIPGEDDDFDGLVNEIDKFPKSGKYTGTITYTGYSKNVPMDFSFVMDYRNFVDNDQNVFNNNFARLAAIMTGNTFGDFSLQVNEGIYENYNEDRTLLLKQFGCVDIEYISTEEETYRDDKNDVHTVQVAHHNFTYNSKDYDVFFIIFKPTIGSLQNVSNFDLGANTDSYRELSGSTHEEWKDYKLHKGIDVTLNRLMPKIQNYIDSKKKVDNPILSVSGYSRGAGLANVYTKKLDDLNKYKIFNYNIAPLAPTQEDEEVAKSYKNIFNIVNDDDIVTQIPWKEIGFRRYGIDVKASISKNYLEEYKTRSNNDYISIGEGWNDHILALGANREEFYEINDDHVCYYSAFDTFEEAKDNQDECKQILDKYKISQYFIWKDIYFEEEQYHLYCLNCLAGFTGFITNIFLGTIVIPEDVQELFDVMPFFSNFSTFFYDFIFAVKDINKIVETIMYPHIMPSYCLLAEHAEVDY